MPILLDMLAAMLDYGDLIAKQTSEMDTPPSTTRRELYYTTQASLDQTLNSYRNHAGWRPYLVLKMGQVVPFANQANTYDCYAIYHMQKMLKSAKIEQSYSLTPLIIYANCTNLD